MEYIILGIIIDMAVVGGNRGMDLFVIIIFRNIKHKTEIFVIA